MDRKTESRRERLGEWREFALPDLKGKASSLPQEREDRMERNETSDVQENRSEVVGASTRHTKRKRRKSIASRLASLRRMVGQKGRRVS